MEGRFIILLICRSPVVRVQNMKIVFFSNIADGEGDGSAQGGGAIHF